MNQKWLKGYRTPDEQESRKAELRGYRTAFGALKELLEGMGEQSHPDYNNPSWSHAQADVNGANRKLREIINLISLAETTKKD